MTAWSPDHYLRFGNERTRPSHDLVGRIDVGRVSSAIDLGCGPGNSTRVLADRWPDARVVGLDSSPEMIDAARAEYPDGEWVLGDVATWTPDASYDVVFSNAALQWVPDHGPLMARLFAAVAPGGALAFQVPSAEYAAVRRLIHYIAREGAWAPRMDRPLGELTMESPGFYYDHLAPLARSIDLWETEYCHVLDSPDAVVEWISSTGLRPFLDALQTAEEREAFLGELKERVRGAYPRQMDGKVLFPFRRTFVIAYA